MFTPIFGLSSCFPYPSFLPLPVILILFSYPFFKPQNQTGLHTVTDSNKGSMISEKKPNPIVHGKNWATSRNII